MENAKEESGRIGVTASNVPRAPPESRAEKKRAYFVKIGVFSPRPSKQAPLPRSPKSELFGPDRAFSHISSISQQRSRHKQHRSYLDNIGRFDVAK